MRGRTTGAVLANPVLVGAVTVLVVVVAVFLAYNANSGLPFVPTHQLNAIVPDGSKLVPGNEVREGGYRIGVLDELESVELPNGSAGAKLTLKLDASAAPIPADSTIRIRPRSALGQKYVDFQRGDAADTLADGATIRVGEEALTPELQAFLDTFDERTRRNARRNLVGYGNAFAFRGVAINRALESLPRFFRELPPVMQVLADPDTQLDRFVEELADAARITAPVVDDMVRGFAAGADTFEALSRDPGALQETIAESPETLAVATTSLRATRPFLNSLASVSDEIRGAAAEVRRSVDPINTALRAGVEPLADLPPFSRRLESTLVALRELAESPGTDLGAATLTEAARTLNPLLQYLGPFQTVCNYWNYSWTYLADHITDKDSTGQVQRIQAKSVDGEQAALDEFGQAYPVPELHAQAYGRAVDPAGQADCETGQRGYPRHLATKLPAEQDIALRAGTPGLQGPTFTGRPSVPEGQTFLADPIGSPELIR